jgi:hypothetical protein
MSATAAPEIAAALGLKRAGHGFSGSCPACGYQGFSLDAKNGRTVFTSHACGCSAGEVITALRSAGLWGDDHETDPGWRPPPPRGTTAPDPARAQAAALRIWRQTVPAEGTAVMAYLKNRGITGPIPATLRSHPALRHPGGATHPAMVAVVPGRAVGAIHRTYLRPDGSGKADVVAPKRSLGRIGGGAVRLAPAGPVLAVSEGIETALSVQAATGLPTWAALSAGGIRALILPALPLAAAVIIAADPDPVGTAAATDAAARWINEGRRVRIAMPPAGCDFNDILSGSRHDP